MFKEPAWIASYSENNIIKLEVLFDNFNPLFQYMFLHTSWNIFKLTLTDFRGDLDKTSSKDFGKYPLKHLWWSPVLVNLNIYLNSTDIFL